MKSSKHVARDPADEAEALGDFWGQVFEQIQGSSIDMKSFRDQFVPSWNLSSPPLAALLIFIYLRLPRILRLALTAFLMPLALPQATLALELCYF